jgi:hypothetical protein
MPLEQLLKKMFNLNIASYKVVTATRVDIISKSGQPYKALRNGDKVTLLKGNFFVSKATLHPDDRTVWSK